MSQATWGKIKFIEKPEKIKDFEQENIWIMFDLPDDEEWPLHVSKLEENEIYFDMLCGYSKSAKYPPQNHPNDDYFMWDLEKGKDKYIPTYSVVLYERLRKIQRVLETLLNLPSVEKLTFFNTWMGPPCPIEDYKEMYWELEDFALWFIKSMNELNMQVPTIMIAFKKAR